MSGQKTVETQDSEEKRLVDEIRSRYERESTTRSAEQVDRLMEAFSRDLYSEPAHYALEFIQNAEDSGSSELSFTVQAGLLLVTNNGGLFDKDDVETICDVARSKKRAKLGYKGLGFKSVIAISERIQIHSASWHFEFNKALHLEAQSQFRWIFIPHWTDKAPTPIDRHFTNFVTFLRGSEGTILKQMEQLTQRSLLFLESLSKITVSDKTQSIPLRVAMFKEAKRASGTSHRVSLGWSKNGAEGRERWILVETKAGPIPDDALLDYRESRKEEEVSEPKVAVAFQVQDGRLTAVKESDTIYAFLPTKEKSGFPFILHSNFLVTASRESLHRRPWNEYIRDHVRQTLLAAVEFFQKDPLFRTTLYEVLPLEDDTADDFYREVSREFREVAADRGIVLADGDRWLKPQGAYLPAKEAIRLLISSEDLGKLLNREARYVHPSVKGARAEKFLRSIGVSTIGKSQVLSFLKNEEWLRCKPPTWFLKLYAYLEREGLSAREIQSLRTARILKDQNGAPGNCSEVFLLPKEHKEQILSLFGQDVRFLHRRLLPVAESEQETERSQAGAFLKRLEVPVADRRQLIESVVMPFFEGDKWQAAGEEKRIKYTTFVKEYLETTEDKSQAHKDLVLKLQECLKVKAKSGHWVLAKHAYLTKEFGTVKRHVYLPGVCQLIPPG